MKYKNIKTNGVFLEKFDVGKFSAKKFCPMIRTRNNLIHYFVIEMFET